MPANECFRSEKNQKVCLLVAVLDLLLLKGTCSVLRGTFGCHDWGVLLAEAGECSRCWVTLNVLNRINLHSTCFGMFSRHLYVGKTCSQSSVCIT